MLDVDVILLDLSGLAMVGPTPSQMMSNKMFCLMSDVVFIKAVIGAFSFSSILLNIQRRLLFVLEQDVRIIFFRPHP